MFTRNVSLLRIRLPSDCHRLFYLIFYFLSLCRGRRRSCDTDWSIRVTHERMATSSSISTRRPSCCCSLPDVLIAPAACCCCCCLRFPELSKRRSRCIELTEHCRSSNAADLTDGSMFLPAAASPRIPVTVHRQQPRR